MYFRFQQSRFIRPLLISLLLGPSLGFIGGLWPASVHPSGSWPWPLLGSMIASFAGLLPLARRVRHRRGRLPVAGCAVLLALFWFVLLGFTLRLVVAVDLLGLALTLWLAVLLALALGPPSAHRWLIALFNGLVFGGGVLLGLWATGSPSWVLTGPFWGLTFLTAAVGGLASTGVRHLGELYWAHVPSDDTEDPPGGELLPSGTGVSRRTFLLGGGSVAGLVISGVGVSWLAHMLIGQVSAILIYREHQDRVISLDWSPDGRRLVSASKDGRVLIWESSSGHTLRSRTGTPADEQTVAWSPDGRHIAVAQVLAPIVILDASNDQTVRIAADTGPGVAWSPDSVRIASAGNTVDIWDLATNQTLVTFLAGPVIFLLAWSPDGRYLATSNGMDSGIWVWDASSGAPVQTCVTLANRVDTVAWSPDGRYLASGGWNGPVQVWDAHSGRALVTYQGRVAESVSSVAWSPDGRRLVSAGDGVHVWEALTGKHLLQYVGHQDFVSVVAWSPDGRWIASGSWDTTIHIWQPG